MLRLTRPPGLLEEDRRLVDRCASGDRAAQTQLFRSEVQRVHALLCRILGTSAAVEDLIQETFIRVFRSLPQFRGEAQLSTWVGRVAIRVAIEHLRTKRRRAELLEAVPPDSASEPSAEQRVVARQGLRRLYQIVGRLDAKLRVAYTLHVIDGRPLREVASMMSTSVLATKTRVWRARREIERRAKTDPWLSSFVQNAPLGETS